MLQHGARPLLRNALWSPRLQCWQESKKKKGGSPESFKEALALFIWLLAFLENFSLLRLLLDLRSRTALYWGNKGKRQLKQTAPGKYETSGSLWAQYASHLPSLFSFSSPCNSSICICSCRCAACLCTKETQREREGLFTTMLKKSSTRENSFQDFTTNVCVLRQALWRFSSDRRFQPLLGRERMPN